MNYKKLGEFIIEKTEFNEGNKYSLLLGVSNNKYFQKAKTNTIDVDLSKYRVAHNNQFVFNRATTRNGEKISIALRKGKSCIVSPSYRIFEVLDENILNSEYLMMWFSRPEFDRYARYHSHGSAHEFFDMEEMCEVLLPIPNIATQRRMVAQYQAVEQKIKTNEALCQKLEATAQALYKHWFVEDDNGEEITIGDLFLPQKGKNITREKAIDGIYPVVAGGLQPSCYHNKSNTKSPVVTISASGANAGYVRLYHSEVWASDCSFVDNEIFDCVYFIYTCLKYNQPLLISKQEGTGQPHIYPEHIVTIPISFYSEEKAKKFEKQISPIYNKKGILEKQSQTLKKLQGLLLSQMAGEK